MKIAFHGWIRTGRLLGMALIGMSAGAGTANSDEIQTDHTGYVETLQPRDTRFVTAIARLTACKIARETDTRSMVPLYPPASRKYHEEGKVVMQFLIDADSCVRKATIVQSSGYFRLDKASLDFAMNLKFPAYMLSSVKTVDDGQLTFAFPMVWKLVAAVPYVPGDRCSGGVRCMDDPPPPPKIEEMGVPPEPGYLWKPGYYVHYPKTGYQWNDGEWAAARPGYHWNAPHWEQFRSKWIFVAGSWEQDP